MSHNLMETIFKKKQKQKNKKNTQARNFVSRCKTYIPNTQILGRPSLLPMPIFLPVQPIIHIWAFIDFAEF